MRCVMISIKIFIFNIKINIYSATDDIAIYFYFFKKTRLNISLETSVSKIRLEILYESSASRDDLSEMSNLILWKNIVSEK